MAIETKAAAETAIRAIVLIIMKIVGTTAQIAIRGTNIRSATKRYNDRNNDRRYDDGRNSMRNNVSNEEPNRENETGHLNFQDSRRQSPAGPSK